MDYIEVDVNTSKDGVLYVFHGPGLSRTTNGSGLITQRLAAEIDQLDAGSWFGPRFAGERVPRLEPFLRWLKGQAKIFFDVKTANLAQLIALVYELKLGRECFFWFEQTQTALEFRRLAPELALKVNVRSVADVLKAAEVYQANIVEVELPHMSQDLVTACRERQLKMMIHHKKNDPAAFRQILAWGADIANVNHGDALARMIATPVENEQNIVKLGVESVEIQDAQLALKCPHTDKLQMSKTYDKSFFIQNGLVFWWHCLACGGWHVTIKES